MVNFGSASQNFAKQVPVEKTRRPAGFYKQLGLDAATVISALWFSFAFSRYIDEAISLSILLGVLLVFSVLSSLQVFMPQNTLRRIAVIILEVAAFLAFTISSNSPKINIALFLILFGFFTWGEISAQKDLKNSLRIRYFRTSQKQIGKVITGITLAVIVIFIPHLDVEKISIPPGAFKTFFGAAANITHRIYPEIDLKLSAQEVAKNIAQIKLAGIEDFRKLPVQEKELAVNRAANEIMNQANKILNKKIKPSQPVSDYFYALITSTLEDWQERLGSIFLIGWGVISFFIARSLGVFVGWFATLFAYLLFQLMQSLNYIHAIGENSMQEVVEY